MGIVAYRDFEPVNLFNASNAQPQLENWQMLPAPPYAEPVAFLDNRAGLGPWAPGFAQRGAYTLDILSAYPRADKQLRFAPPEPIRKDVYMQLAQRAKSPNVAGQAPTSGIYTGVSEE